MLALFNLVSKVNTVHTAFANELDLSIRPTDDGVQKIDGTMLNIYGIVVVAFSLKDTANQVRFFEETLSMANISPKVVFGMPFLTLSGADVNFLGFELR